MKRLTVRALLVSLAACGPSMTDPPATSAASDLAAAGPAASVATALHGDPPLPGEPSGGAHHHHMEGMDMPDTKDGGHAH